MHYSQLYSVKFDENPQISSSRGYVVNFVDPARVEILIENLQKHAESRDLDE